MGGTGFWWTWRVLGSLLLVPGILGWGKEGHYTICKIAEGFLSAEALAAVKELLPASAKGHRLVSRQWCSLVANNPCFDDRFLRVQINKQRLIKRSLTFTNPRDPRDFFTTSVQPWAPKRVLRGDRQRRNFSLSFLPCFQGPVKTIAKGGEPIVVLCTGTRWFQQDYRMCYPCTMQWGALPLLNAPRK